jgi:hypothetical protein
MIYSPCPIVIARRFRVGARELACLLLASAPALTSQAATTPVFQNNNAEPIGSILFGDHDVDINTASPASLISNMPLSGTLPASPSLLSPWNGTGFTISTAGGSSKAKGGAGHTEGSNLAKITFPSGVGLDQTDPAPHDVGPSSYRINFNYVWALSNPGTLGPPLSGTFSIPVGVKVGTGAGAYAKFEWEIHWDARVSEVVVPDVRSPFIGSTTFTGAGTYVTSVSAPSSTFAPTSIAGSGDNLIVVRGFIGFEANNDDSRTVIEVLGKELQNLDDELRASPEFNALYNDPDHPEFRAEAGSGFEEVVPEPSSALLAVFGSAGLLRRRRRQRN